MFKRMSVEESIEGQVFNEDQSSYDRGKQDLADVAAEETII